MNNKVIKDSGDRTDFGTGAVRDARIGKGRMDLVPLQVIQKLLSEQYSPKTRMLFKDVIETESNELKDIHLFMFTGNVEFLFNAIIDIVSHNKEYYNEYVNIAKELECEVDYEETTFMQVLSASVIALSKHFEQGAQKYGERNWEKGIPLHFYIDSALRHYMKIKAGFDDENHHLACLWNLVCAIWVVELGEEKLFDLPYSQQSMQQVCLKVKESLVNE
jgi:hypothetical protein